MKRVISLMFMMLTFATFISCSDKSDQQPKQNKISTQTRKPKPPQIVPEEEKTLRDVMIILPAVEKRYVESLIKDSYLSLFEALPDYCTMHIILDEKLDLSQSLKAKMEKLVNINWYPINMHGYEKMYAQDLCEVGLVDSLSGQFELIVPRLFLGDRSKKRRNEHQQLDSTSLIGPVKKEIIDDFKSQYDTILPDNHSLIFKELAKSYPKTFRLTQTKEYMIIEGGNIQRHLLPNGKIGLFIGSQEIMKMMIRRRIPLNSNVNDILREVKAYYRADQIFMGPTNRGIKIPQEIFAVEESNITSLAKESRHPIDALFLEKIQFFMDYHLDFQYLMVSTKNGSIPVVSSIEKHLEYFGDAIMREYFGVRTDAIITYWKAKEKQAVQQLQQSGYKKIVKVPMVTPSAVYSNFIAYVDKNTSQSTVIMPTYTMGPFTKFGRNINLAKTNRIIKKIEKDIKQNLTNLDIMIKQLNPEKIDERYIQTDYRFLFRKGGPHCKVSVIQ